MKALFTILSILIISIGFGQTTLVSYTLTADGNGSDAQYVDSKPFSSVGTSSITFASTGARASGWPTSDTQTDYFEITVKPETGYTLNISEIKFGERRSNTSIRDYQVRWSTDDFATYTTIATVNVPDNDSERSGNISSLNIDVNDGDSVQIRWYGYNAESGGGTWRINNGTLEVIGSVNNASSNDTDSKAEAPASQTAATNIPSTAVSSASAVEVIKFKITDIGTSDGKPTKVTRIRLRKKSGSQLLDDWIKGFVLKQGANTITLSSIYKASNASYFDLNISSGDLEIADGTSEEFSVSIYLENSLRDNESFSFFIDANDNGFTADNLGSEFSSDFGSDINSNTITITVAATKLTFATQPSSTSQGNTMSPSPKISYVDANNNIDKDISGSSNAITISSTGTLDGASTTTVDPSNGNVYFSNIIHSSSASAIHLTATSANSSFANINSSNFNITSAPIAPTVDSLFISEVSEGPNTNTEFIEFRNVSDDAIDLENCTLLRLLGDGTVKSTFVLGDNNFTGDLIVKAGGYLVISRGATRSEFESDWPSFPAAASFLEGNNGMYFGAGTAYRWRLTYDDGAKAVTTIDDTQDAVGGSGNTSNQTSAGTWTTTSYSGNSSPGERNANSELPIELLYFKARNNSNSVSIYWQTATEKNNDFFTIERSYDALHFEEIYKIMGAGNSNSAIDYKYSDYNADQSQIIYYKLKQTDFDGKHTYSNTISVGLINSTPDFYAYYNSSKIYLQLTAKRDNNIELSIIDISGRLIYNSALPIDKDLNTYRINIPNIANGIYFLKLHSSDGSENYKSKKLIIK